MFYAARYSLFAEFLAANADYFNSKRSLAAYNSYPTGIPSTAGTFTRVSNPYFEAGAPQLFSNQGSWFRTLNIPFNLYIPTILLSEF